MAFFIWSETIWQNYHCNEKTLKLWRFWTPTYIVGSELLLTGIGISKELSMLVIPAQNRLMKDTEMS